MNLRWEIFLLIFIYISFVSNIPLTVSCSSSSISFLADKYTSFSIDYDVETEHNKYTTNGNSSVLIAIDSHLLGPEEYFRDELDVIEVFEYWFVPFEERFGIDFHVEKVTTFTPTLNDSLDDSISNVPDQIGWNFSTNLNDPLVNGNGYDWLIIYQEYYGQGRNRVNAVNGNALIIAHYQPLEWTSRQLILLHEIGHLFSAVHYENGYIPPSWYNGTFNATHSIMSYTDLRTLHVQGWDKDNLPIDEHNYLLINSSKYRFDLNDADLDGLPNYYEYRHGLKPNFNDLESDLDNDGLSNIMEYTYGTDPTQCDSDSDNFSDWGEVYLGTNPMNSSSTPSISIPIILAWTEDRTIEVNKDFNLEWRGLSSNRDYYEIYKNSTLQTHNDWSTELITFSIKEDKSGKWNFTCLVVDQLGNKVSASIFIQVTSSRNTPQSFLGSFLAIFVIAFIFRKNLSRKYA